MIDAAVISEILSVYAKHGWLLRRVLLSEGLQEQLKETVSALFGDAPIFESGIDAIWVSRPPRSGGVAWEIRHLSNAPYALLENIDETDAGFESAIRTVEKRLLETLAAKNRA